MAPTGPLKRRKQFNSHISLFAIKQYLSNGSYEPGATPIDKRAVRKRSLAFRVEDGELYYIHQPKRLDFEPPDPNEKKGLKLIIDKKDYRRVIMTPKQQTSLVSHMHISPTGRSILEGGHF